MNNISLLLINPTYCSLSFTMGIEDKFFLNMKWKVDNRVEFFCIAIGFSSDPMIPNLERGVWKYSTCFPLKFLIIKSKISL